MRRCFSVLKGKATPEGTEFFTRKNPKVREWHWKLTSSYLSISSFGIGTYIGAPDEETDQQVYNAVVESVSSGVVNVVDTAINYRYQKAERSVGKALQTLAEQNITRDQVFLASKIGYIPEDADKGLTGKAIIKELEEKGEIKSEDIVGGVHCMHPNFLKDQLKRSLENLQVETLDLLYLHNAAESQMPALGEAEFWKRLEKVFEFMEEARSQNQIVDYGMATWICFRSPSSEQNIHLSLEKVVELAEKVGGKDHGMKYVQLPINLMMPEAFVQPWQSYKGKDEIFLNVAKDLGINVVTSSPLLQSKILELKLSKSMLGVETQAVKHLQLIRSIPSSSIKSVLVGMKNPRNVTMNLQLGRIDPLEKEDFWNVLKPEGKEHLPISIDLW